MGKKDTFWHWEYNPITAIKSMENKPCILFLAKAVEKSDMFTPKGKRKRGEGDEKENQPPQGVKMARKLLGGNSMMLALKFIDGIISL